MYERINNILNNYKDNPNNIEQDKDIKEVLTFCLTAMYTIERENGELVERILKAEKREAQLVDVIQQLKDKANDFLSSWTMYGW
jgi:uncharacterized protein YebE (UPF0316 family)